MHLIIRNTRFVLTGVILTLVLEAYAYTPDEWRGAKGRFILQNWSLSLNVGFTSYYGDLSQYDGNFPLKLVFESKPAVGLKLTKYLIPVLGVSGQVIYGGFHSDFLEGHSFETRLVEYNFMAVLDVTRLVFPGKLRDYGLEVSAGMGQFLFQTSLTANDDGQHSVVSLKNGTPEFVYFFGGEFYYKINRRFRLTANLSIRQAQNDNIDKYVASNDYDYYSWFSFGITWSINSTFSVKRYRAMNRVNKHPPFWRR